jgi:hypothetical protein
MMPAHNPHTLANEVRLKRTQFAGTFLLVEGPDDSRFYRRFIEPRHCRLSVGFSKENVISAIDLLDAGGVNGILGVVDSDFDVLEGKNLPSLNLVRGDCHDVEALLVRSPSLETVLHEFASHEKLVRFEAKYNGPVRKWLVETARCLGYLRWNSLRAGLKLRFEGLAFSHFVNPLTLELDAAALRAEIKNNSQNWKISDRELNAAGWPADKGEDPWQLCCGHDLVELLTLALRRAIGSKQGLTTDGVSSALRLAYSHEHFVGSALRAQVGRWEAATGYRVFLADE